MSETKVETVNHNTLVDLFGDVGAASKELRPTFGMEEGNADLFATAPSTSTTEQTTQVPNSDDNPDNPDDKNKNLEENDDPEKDVDILGTDDDKGAQPQGTALSDLASYYEDRIKKGKFVAIEDVDKDGKPIPFVPKTAEEYDEVLELQINYRLDQAKKELEKNWFSSKSPAWKAVSQYAELVDDPSHLIPFLQGVRTMTSISGLDENELEGAEQIVRTRLSQRGDTDEIINQQIEALKTTDKLISTAKLYKPVILQQEQQSLQQQMMQRQQEERQYQTLISEIRDNALKSIESPVFGKTKLKNDEKAAIYDLIAEPAEETQGYGIYNAIDDLFEKKNFEVLKEIALLLTNREAFMSYLGTSVANATAASLERKLRLAGESRSASGNDFYQDDSNPKVTRNQFKSKPTFGRS